MVTTEQEQRAHGAAAVVLDPALQEQIAQALQPVAAMLHRQVEEEVRRQVEQSFHQIQPELLVETRPGAASASQPQDRQTQQPDQAPDEEHPAPARQSQVAKAEQGPPAAQSVQQPPQDEDTETEDERGVGELMSNLVHSSGDVLLQVVRERGQEYLQSWLKSMLDAIFSPEVRVAAQQQISESVRVLLEETFEAIPQTDPSGGTEQKAIQELDSALQDALERIFGSATRIELQRRGDLVIEALLRGDFDTAQIHAGRAAEMFFGNILDALGRHWNAVLRVLLRVLIKALEDVVASKIKEAFAGGPGALGSEVQEKTEGVQEQVKEKAEQLRGKMSGAADTMRDEIERAKKELEENLQEGLKSGLKEGTSNTQLGRPPSVSKPPSRRRPSPARRAPPGRPPSGRPPSGRPPGMR